ncbi:MAG TPA: hypothetical protein PLP23_21045 [Panacibacter sp.]|nr:hypothetical protein [Panacibacter sp.]
MKHSQFITHIAAAIIVSVIMLTIYATVQQAHRSAANDPQIQLARDIVENISHNNSYSQLLPGDTIEISKSLATFVALYNLNGDPINSTGTQDGKMPKLPKGVFEFARSNNENVFTWQPRPGVREAMVLKAVRSSEIGFVAVGRSLNEVEQREANLLNMILIAWAGCMAVIIIHYIIQFSIFKRQAVKERAITG